MRNRFKQKKRLIIRVKRKSLKLIKYWIPMVKKYTKLTEEELSDIARMVLLKMCRFSEPLVAKFQPIG